MWMWNLSTCKEDYSCDPSTYICEDSKTDLKSSANDSLINFDEIITVADSVSTNVTNNVLTSFYNKKVRYEMDCFILHQVLLVINSLFAVLIICYHYAKPRQIQKIYVVVLTI